MNKKLDIDEFLFENWAKKEKVKKNSVYINHNIFLLKTVIKLLEGKEVEGVRFEYK